jgi:antitoxin YefM
MYTTYKLKANDLNDDFLQSVKALFHDKVVEISICDSNEAEEDETAYLLKNPANKQHLLNAISNVENGSALIEISLPDL